MSLVPYLAVLLAAVTVVVALTTGQRLGERRKALFHMEMQAEQLRRLAADLDADRDRAEGQARALRGLLLRRRQTLAELDDELRALRAGGEREVGVHRALRQRVFSLEEVAA